MTAEDRYDSLIQFYWEQAANRFGFRDDPAADWRVVKAQIRAESAFDPQAKNVHTGSLGLLQLMEATDLEHDGIRDAGNPEEAIREGIHYLGKQWKMFAEETGLERWKFALAAYNCGAGNVLKAQALLQAEGRPTDAWGEIAAVLVQITGPDHAQETIHYVRRITSDFLAARTVER